MYCVQIVGALSTQSCGSAVFARSPEQAPTVLCILAACLPNLLTSHAVQSLTRFPLAFEGARLSLLVHHEIMAEEP